MKISINCPAGCYGTGKIHIIKQRCPYCNGAGKLTLTKHLRTMGEYTRMKNVADFEATVLTEELQVQENTFIR